MTPKAKVKNTKKPAWNRGVVVGQKIGFTKQEARTIRHLLENKGNLRDLTLFCTGVDLAFRSVDLLSLRVRDILSLEGRIKEAVTIRQQKTQKPVTTYLTSGTQNILERWLEEMRGERDSFLFPSRKRAGARSKAITHARLAQLIKEWAKWAGLNPELYSTHSLRRTRVSEMYRVTGNHDACRIYLGQTHLDHTQRYLGTNQEIVREIAEGVEIWD
jgi:integrase